MAQSGYTPILIYASGTATNVPLAANMTSSASGAELALNYTDGKLYYKDNAGVVKLLASNATSAPVLTFSAGTTGFTPSSATSGAVTLAGTLITSNGGTGLSSYTAGDLSYYASGTALTKLAIGTAGQFLTSTGTAPQWSTLSGVAVTTFSAGTTGFTPSSATAGAVTLAGTLATTNGGTGLTSFTSGGVVYASSTSALATGSALTFNGTTTLSVSSSLSGASNYMRVINSSNTANSGALLSLQTGGTSGGTAAIEYYNQTTAIYAGATTSYGYYFVGASPDGSTPYFVANSTGLGIGTTSPNTPLQVNGTIKSYTPSVSNSNFLLRNSTTGDALGFAIQQDGVNSYIYNNSNGVMGFATNAVERLRITSTGNVGIGTSAPASRLHVYGGTLTTLTLGNGTANDYSFLRAESYPGANNGYTIFSIQAFSSLVSTSVNVGNLGFTKEGAGTDNKAYFDISTHNGTSLSERLRITAAGNVGIGTSSPLALLQLDSGDIRLQGSAPGKILFFSTGNGVSQNATLEVANDGATTNTGEFKFSTRNQAGTLAERVRILAGGAFLVGQTSTVNGGGASLQGNLATGAVGVSGSFATVWTIPSGTLGIFTANMGGNGQYGGAMLFFVSYGQFPAGGNAYVVALAGPGGDQSGYGWSWQLASGGQFQMRNNTNTVAFVPAISMLTLA